MSIRSVGVIPFFVAALIVSQSQASGQTRSNAATSGTHGSTIRSRPRPAAGVGWLRRPRVDRQGVPASTGPTSDHAAIVPPIHYGRLVSRDTLARVTHLASGAAREPVLGIRSDFAASVRQGEEMQGGAVGSEGVVPAAREAFRTAIEREMGRGATRADTYARLHVVLTSSGYNARVPTPRSHALDAVAEAALELGHGPEAIAFGLEALGENVRSVRNYDSRLSSRVFDRPLSSADESLSTHWQQRALQDAVVILRAASTTGRQSYARGEVTRVARQLERGAHAPWTRQFARDLAALAARE